MDNENFNFENLPPQKVGPFNLKRPSDSEETLRETWLERKKRSETAASETQDEAGGEDDFIINCSQIQKKAPTNRTDAVQCLLIGREIERQKLEIDYAHERRFNNYLRLCKETIYSYSNKDDFFSESGTDSDRITFKFGSELPIKVRLGVDSSNSWKIFMCKKNYSTKSACVSAIPWCDVDDLMQFLNNSVRNIQEGKSEDVIHSLFLGTDDILNNPREQYFWANSFTTESGKIRIKFLRVGTRYELWWNNLFVKNKPEEGEKDEEKEEKRDEKRDEKKDEKNDSKFGTVLKLTIRELMDLIKVINYIVKKCPANEAVMLGHNLNF